MTHHRHLAQRIFEPLPAIAADFITFAFDRKNPAQMGMMTTKGKIQNTCKWFDNSVPSRNFVADYHFV